MSLLRSAFQKITGNEFTDASDEFLNWLLASCPGMQHRGNILCFGQAIQNLPSEDPIVEIGAHAGLSANIICYLLKKHGRKNPVISIDPWIVRGWDDGKENVPEEYLFSLGSNPHVKRSDFAEFMMQSYIRNVKFFSAENLPFAFRMTSDTFFEKWNSGAIGKDIMGREMNSGGRISFVYIDGNHDYDFAKRDFVNADRHLVPGGFVLFDDSQRGSPFGCAKVAEEVKADERYTLVAENPNLLFRKSRG
ncbi:MAG TPA: class I SAM-dependent methyltransferase [Bacteroidia bacterium]|nr:class I SAM-dependent methyltransferase [Bacteroidia bacterium]